MDFLKEKVKNFKHNSKFNLRVRAGTPWWKFSFSDNSLYVACIGTDIEVEEWRRSRNRCLSSPRFQSSPTLRTNRIAGAYKCYGAACNFVDLSEANTRKYKRNIFRIVQLNVLFRNLSSIFVWKYRAVH